MYALKLFSLTLDFSLWWSNEALWLSGSHCVICHEVWSAIYELTLIQAGRRPYKTKKHTNSFHYSSSLYSERFRWSYLSLVGCKQITCGTRNFTIKITHAMFWFWCPICVFKSSIAISGLLISTKVCAVYTASVFFLLSQPEIKQRISKVLSNYHFLYSLIMFSYTTCCNVSETLYK